MNSLFSNIFELLFRSGSGITADLYDNNLYGILGIVAIVLPILVAAVFYFAMDKARYATVMHWLGFFLLNFVIIFLFALLFPKRQIEASGGSYPFSDYLYLSLVVSLWSMIIFFLISLVFKRFTSSLARTPF